MLFVLGIFMFVLLIVVHEYGHFLVAKRNGVEVEEFGIGIPPRMFGRKMGRGIFRSYYSFNWLPIGGFVKLKGESDDDKRKGSFGSASLWAKTKITMAGVMMNFLGAIVIFSVLSGFGIPVLLDNQVSIGSDTTDELSAVKVGYIEEGSPAEQSGLELEDDIISVNGNEISINEELYDLTEQNAGETVVVSYIRDGQPAEKSIQLNEEDDDSGYLGIIPYQITTRTSSWLMAPVNGAAVTGQFAWETYRGVVSTIGDLIGGEVEEAKENVSGPVGIIVILRNIDSMPILMMFIGLISITLGVMNSLPIPALDGGRLAVMILFRGISRELTAKKEQAIHSTGMVMLLMLIALITFVDVNRFF